MHLKIIISTLIVVCTIHENIMRLLCVCNVSAKCLDKLRAVCVSHLIDPHPHWIWLRHILFTPDFSRLTEPVRELSAVFFIGHCTVICYTCGASCCIQNYSNFLEILGLDMEGFLGVFLQVGTLTEVEIRSAYRAHIIFDTNNFHSKRAAPLVKESKCGLEHLMLFSQVFW